MTRTLIAGASSEIGAAIAVELAGAGHSLVLWGRDPERLERVRQDCADAGAPSAAVTHVDVSDRSSLVTAADDVTSPSLTNVVWSIGAFDWAPADSADLDAWERVIAVNLTAAALATRLLLPGLIASAPGSIVYIGSGAGRRAFPNNAAYVAAKHGLRALAEAIHLDAWPSGIRTSTISTGPVLAGSGRDAPEAHQTEEMLVPADISAAVRFVIDFPARGAVTEIILGSRASLRRPEDGSSSPVG